MVGRLDVGDCSGRVRVIGRESEQAIARPLEARDDSDRALHFRFGEFEQIVTPLEFARDDHRVPDEFPELGGIDVRDFLPTIDW